MHTAYAVHGDVSNYMSIPAFDTSSTPTSTQVTAMIVLADAAIDSFIGGASLSAGLLKNASCMIVANMIERGKKYLIAPDEVSDVYRRSLVTAEVAQMLQEGLDAASDVALVVSSQDDYQTSSDPDDFV